MIAMRAPTVILIASLPACATPPLEERLDEPDVAIPADCAFGTTEIEVSGSVIDFVTGQPVAGATVDLTEAFTGSRTFPNNGCRIGTTVTSAAGQFGPVMVRAESASPVLVFLVTGAGRAPTIHDKTVGCLLGCNIAPQEIPAPTAELVEAWRADLFDGGMEYALNRGLVAYKFHDTAGNPAAGVTPIYRRDVFDDERRVLDPGSQVRFLEPDRQTLALADRSTTLGAGTALIGIRANASGYFRVGGERGSDRWPALSVIAATGWIYFESDSLTPPP
jgi:hypothetical protein